MNQEYSKFEGVVNVLLTSASHRQYDFGNVLFGLGWVFIPHLAQTEGGIIEKAPLENHEEPFEIRDMRGGDWFWAPNAILHDPDLTATAKMTYMAMAVYANRYQYAWPSNKVVAKICEVSERSVQRAKKQLEEKKYIKTILVPNKPSKYVLLRIPSRGDKLSPGDTTAARGDTSDTPLPGVGVTPQHPEQYEQNNEPSNSSNKKPNPKVLDKTRAQLVEQGVIPK